MDLPVLLISYSINALGQVGEVASPRASLLGGLPGRDGRGGR